MRLSVDKSGFASLSNDSDFGKVDISVETGTVRFSNDSDFDKVSVFGPDFTAIAAAVRISNELDLLGVFCGSGFADVTAASFFSFSRCFNTIARFQAGRLANCSSSLTCFCCSSVSFCFLRSIRACFQGGTDILAFVKQPRLQGTSKNTPALNRIECFSRWVVGCTYSPALPPNKVVCP